MRRISLEDWQKEGRKLFGDPKQWTWVCPSCGHRQSFQDFLDLGMEPEMVQKLVSFSCIGRWRPSCVELGERDQGHGCNYAGGGLFLLSPVRVVIDEDNNEVRPTFEWAPKT